MRQELFTIVLTTSLVALLHAPSAAAADSCSQPVSSGSAPVATDCLYILRAAVGIQACDPACICAPKGELPTSATDALVCLNVSVGISVPLACPCSTTTTSSSTVTSTVTSTTSTLETSTTTETTTTTIAEGDIERGRTKYDSLCTYCHAAVPHDLVAEVANNLAGKGELLVLQLGTIAPEMEDFVLTEQELADLAAFLESL